MAEAVPLTSSWMRSAQYDEEEKTLEIVLDDGKSYTYQGVPVSVYQGLITATSAGHYFRLNIRNRFSET